MSRQFKFIAGLVVLAVVARAITPGAGLIDTAGVWSLDPSVPARITVVTTLSWTSLAQSTCQEQTITLTGAAPGDEPNLGPPANMVGLGVVIGHPIVSATDTVTVQVCKMTTGSVTPPTGNWRASIVRAGTW